MVWAWRWCWTASRDGVDKELVASSQGRALANQTSAI